MACQLDAETSVNQLPSIDFRRGGVHERALPVHRDEEVPAMNGYVRGAAMK
jgi:hypothetical protein